MYKVYLGGEAHGFDRAKSKNSSARQCRSRRVGDSRLKKQTKVNANANTKGEVAINGRGVKIARRAAVLA